tara:strand:- start:1566 stop:2162 length:597 start_codon:yes stop_codon:yes gene_type:complete
MAEEIEIEMEEQDVPVGSIEAKDDFAVAPPGHSLTQDNSKWAWGKPPQDVDPEVVLEKAIRGLKNKKTQQEMQKLLFAGVSVETMVEGYILQGFHEGKFTPDVGLLIKAPLAIVIADMAERNSIPYRMFENNDAGQEGVMDDKTFFRMIKTNNPRMFEYIRESVNQAIRQGNEPLPEETEENFLNMNPPTEETEEEKI